MADNEKFRKLLEPGQIGRVKTKNRMFKTAAGSTLGDGTGNVTDRHKAFYGAIAKGGVGFISVEHCETEAPTGDISMGSGTFLRLDDDKFIPSLVELTQLIHKYNCMAFVQLQTGGATSGGPGVQPISSSPLTHAEMVDRQPYHKVYLLNNPPPRALTIEEIEEIVDKFIKTAERAAKAGFDGIEVNGGNGHLINAFLSRVWNRRDDKYGCQNLENRTRFMVEIIQAIKKCLGQDFPVTATISGAEYGLADCTTIEEGIQISQILQNAGADAIQPRTHGYTNITMDTCWPEHVLYPEPPKPLPKDCDWSRWGAGATAPVTEAIKKAVSVPVFIAGRIYYPELAESILRNGQADFIGFTRSLQADPELPNKIASGRRDEIAPCIACNYCLDANTFRKPIVCSVNAALGGEQEYTIKQAARKKKVLVVGGGPAGMEAARVAALRGHEVILYEKESKLGGIVPLAAMIKGLEIEDPTPLVRYLKTQITKLGVDVRLGKEFTPALAEQIKPDAAILAPGGKPFVPDIPGINRRIVVNGPKLYKQLKFYLKFFGPRMLRWLTKFWMPLGKRVVIIGGAIQGMELAEFLVKRGRSVTVLETSEKLGELMYVRNALKLLKWLPQKGATLLAGVKYEEITDKGITITTKEGKRQTIDADTIVTAVPFQPNTELLKTLEGKVPEVYLIGDGRESRVILDATADGWRTARAI